MTAAPVITLYEAVRDLMVRMRAAAQAHQWDELVALEKQCRALVATLGERDRQEPLDRAGRARKAALIREVLAHDAAIRDITEPWMKHLQSLIGSSSRARQLSSAYRDSEDRG